MYLFSTNSYILRSITPVKLKIYTKGLPFKIILQLELALQKFIKFMKILSRNLKFGVFTKFLDHENLEPYSIIIHSSIPTNFRSVAALFPTDFMNL